ncbi:NAD(P)/FAD-dependent oxidoreductase [Paraburkholderia caribensis]|uniref:NAD(P)/FAD-dependent oxidoreductase n=1 Tax=Paraburkholderia caribensis TaxID=75105 RepID=UPI001CC80EE7|nr:FAD-dependent oxidoreductase [Paraburkholderia caribensis]
MSTSIVIVGAGQTGAWIARSVREAGFDGNITLLGDEPHLPYERPPLSKAGMIGGESAFAPVFERDEYEKLNISFEPGKRVVAIQRHERQVVCADGSQYLYDRLAIATGGRARRPAFPGSDMPGVMTLRTLEDATAISERLTEGGHALVIGGGWIGLEMAAAARQRGMSVTVLEAADRLCARSLPAFMSDYLLSAHVKEGVDVRTKTSLERIDAADDGRLIATLTNGDQLEPADLVVIGVGLIPNVELALEAGLHVNDGIVVDETGATSDPAIFAAGDVASIPFSWRENRLRLESWANAQNHGIAVGRAIAGESVKYDDLPWFWSDQYDMNIQMVGLFVPGLQEIVRGDPATRRFTLFQVDGSRIVAAASVNAARDLKRTRQIIKDGKTVNVPALADSTVPLERACIADS